MFMPETTECSAEIRDRPITTVSTLANQRLGGVTVTHNLRTNGALREHCRNLDPSPRS